VSALGINKLGTNKMKKTAVMTLILVSAACPVMASPHHVYQHSHAAYQHPYRRYQHSQQVYRNFQRAYQNSHHAYQDVRRANEPANNPGAHSNITCDMVRNYVAQVGVQQAKAMAVAAGMTASEERKARQCLASGV
jgi:hypothetical protein